MALVLQVVSRSAGVMQLNPNPWSAAGNRVQAFAIHGAVPRQAKWCLMPDQECMDKRAKRHLVVIPSLIR